MALSPLAPHSSSPSELKDRVLAERRGHPFLLYRDGGDNQRIVDLDEAPDELTIGRRPSNQIPLSWDLSVSRVHAQVTRVGDYWTVSDDGLSRNGSYVNGSRVTGRRRLIDGDLLRFGDTVIAYCDAERGVLLALCRPYKNSDGFAAPASNKQIADELCIGVDGVKSHMRALFYVFGVGKVPQNQKRAQLVERAFRSGVVTDRD